MSRLTDAQSQFAEDIAILILWVHSHYEGGRQIYRVRGGDWFRDPRCDYGHPRSLHRKRLAIDLHLDRWNGQRWIYQKKTEAYRFAGEHWEDMRPEHAWGGHFDDGNHFSRKWGRMR